MTDFTTMSISAMVAHYNELAEKMTGLGGAANKRKAFRDRDEAERFCKALEERVAAREDEISKEPEVTETTTASKEKKPRALKGKDPADELTPMRAGSIRAKILALMDGTRTPAQIAREVDLEDHKVAAHLATMNKASGIGYGFDAERRVTAVYPAGKTYDDAVKEKAEPAAAAA